MASRPEAGRNAAMDKRLFLALGLSLLFIWVYSALTAKPRPREPRATARSSGSMRRV